jgi:hypothetical protein
MKRPLLLTAIACFSCAGPEQPQANAPSAASTQTTVEVTNEPAPPPRAATVVKRVGVTLGRPSGTSVITTEPDGTIHTKLDVLENGRGPQVEATFKLASDGTIVSFDASGRHTMGARFTSTFRNEGGVARWKSEEESGERKVSEPTFYMPLAEVPELEGMLVQAALARNGKISVLPAGNVVVVKTGEVELAIKGEKRKLVGYEIGGLDFLPVQTWMNADGSWFGTTSEWFSLVPEGWEAAIEPLIAKQLELKRARDAQRAAALTHRPPAAGLAYTHARVLDVEGGKWLADQTVFIVGDTIKSVGPSKTAKLPEGVEIIDVQGRALIPGLWDMHAHYSDETGVLNIASGVTTARDVGNDPDKLDDFKQRFDSGTAIGPHTIRFGFIEGRNEKAASSKITAETEDEAKAGVKFYLDRKYDGIKIYNSVRPELVPVIAKEAHAAKLRVTGHIPVHMLAHEAVKAGYDGIEHINMVFLNFFATHDTDTRDLTRFTLVGEKAPDFDLASKPVKDFLAVLKQRKILVDPTVNVFENLYVGQQGKIVPGLEGIVSRLPLNQQRYFLLGALPVNEHTSRYPATFDKLLAMIKALYDAKVPLAVGTDNIPGLMLHHEMVLFARAGIPNAAVLRIATLDSARNMGMDKVTGSIKPGKRADLVLIDGDPLARMEDIERVSLTMRGGIEFNAQKLYDTVSVRPL